MPNPPQGHCTGTARVLHGYCKETARWPHLLKPPQKPPCPHRAVTVRCYWEEIGLNHFSDNRELSCRVVPLWEPGFRENHCKYIFYIWLYHSSKATNHFFLKLNKILWGILWIGMEPKQHLRSAYSQSLHWNYDCVNWIDQIGAKACRLNYLYHIFSITRLVRK